MLFHLLFQFAYPRTQWPVLNVTRYITFRTAAASLTALAATGVLAIGGAAIADAASGTSSSSAATTTTPAATTTTTPAASSSSGSSSSTSNCPNH